MIPVYQENIGLVHTIAKRCMGWVVALGLPLDYEDVFQDVSLAFVTAARKYDPKNENGIKFSSYLTQAAYHQLKKTVGAMTGVKRLNEKERKKLKDIQEENKERQKKGLAQKATFMGLSIVSIDDLSIGDDDSDERANPIDVFPSDCKSPEQVIAEQQEWRYLFKRLSPLAKLIVNMIENPPVELVYEMEAQYAHDKIKNNHSVKRAGKVVATPKIVVAYLMKIMPERERELVQAEKELLRAARRM